MKRQAPSPFEALNSPWDDPSKLVFVQRRQESSVLMRNNSGISSRLGKAIGMPLDVRRETQVRSSSATVILGFLSMLKRSHASSPFQALNFVCLSQCQRDMSRPVQMVRGPRAFSRASTGDSDIPSLVR